MNTFPTKNQPSDVTGSQPFPELDAALQALNQVQPPARLEQRVHARLAQETFGKPSLPARFAAAFTWPRAAFATATFAAGAIAATLALPILQPVRLRPIHVGGPALPAATAQTPPSSQSPLKTADAHPALTVRGPGGRVAAMNAASTVASTRSRRQHSDTQLAANKQQRKGAEARLARPQRIPSSPPTGNSDASPGTDPSR